MSVDLTLCPIPYASQKWWLAYDRVELKCDYDLYSLIAAFGRGCHEPVMQPQPIPPDKYVDWYGDQGIQRVDKDAYGTPLTYVPAGEFRNITAAHLSEASKWNRAVISMLQLLPKDTPVVLWWH